MDHSVMCCYKSKDINVASLLNTWAFQKKFVIANIVLLFSGLILLLLYLIKVIDNWHFFAWAFYLNLLLTIILARSYYYLKKRIKKHVNDDGSILCKMYTEEDSLFITLLDDSNIKLAIKKEYIKKVFESKNYKIIVLSKKMIIPLPKSKGISSIVNEWLQ